MVFSFLSSSSRSDPHSHSDNVGSVSSPLRRMAIFLRPYRLKIWGAVAALSIAAATVLAIGGALRCLVDYGLSADNTHLLNLSLMGLFGIIFLLALASFFRSYLVSTIGEHLIADIRRRVYAALIRLGPGFYEQTNTGELISRVTADTTILQSVLAGTLPMALRNLILVAGGLVMLFVSSAKLSLLFIIAVPVILVPIIIFARKVRALSRQTQDEIGKIGAHIDETIHGVEIVQSFSQESRMNRTFENLAIKVLAAATRHIGLRSLMSSLAIFIIFSSIAIILWIGGHDVIRGEMSPGTLTSFVFYAVLTASAAGTLSEVYGSLNQAAGAAERLFELMDEPLPQENTTGLALPEDFADQPIRISDVSFAYQAFPDRKVLNHFDLEIKPGETIAFVGPSGAGKTTLFKMLLRFYDPHSGNITLGGTQIDKFDLSAYRKIFGVVPQDPILFSDTLRNNILFGVDETRKKNDRINIESLARLANADGFISRLPDGYNTLIGERGTRLSGGQRQRIAIARALAHDPKILIFDEATSSLDSNSEQAIQSALKEIKKDYTTLIIAHRLSTVLIADRICVIQDGKISAIGTHKSLLKNSALYAEMVKNQMIDL